MTALEDILSQEIVQRLGWTLLHFIWQATAIALLLAILLAGLRKASADLRYTVSCLSLGLIVLLPAVTMWLVEGAAAQPPVVPESAQAPVVLRTEQVEEIPMAQMQVVEVSAKSEEPRKVPAIPWRQRAAERLEPALSYIVSGWLLGVFALSLRHLGGWTQLQRLRRKLVKPVDVSLRAKLDELAETLGVKLAVQLTESALVQIPTVVGWLRPVILLPASALTGLAAEQLEAILAHELAHIRRHDYLVNMLQTVVETLGFYHPAVWWVSHRIRAEREDCCDDLAVGVCGDRLGYARALTSMEEIRAGRSELAVAASGGNLLRRICRLLGKNSEDNSRASWIPLAITILLILTIAVPITFALTMQKRSDGEAGTAAGLAEGFDLETPDTIEREIDRFLEINPDANTIVTIPDAMAPDTEGHTNLSPEQDRPIEDLHSVGSAAGTVSVVGSAIENPTASDEGKPYIRIDALVVEILDHSRMDRETFIQAQNKLNLTISASSGWTPTPEELVREAAGSRVWVDGSLEMLSIVGDRQATQEQYNAMVNVLASRGLVKMLMSPTLEVVAGGKARFSAVHKVPIGNGASRPAKSAYHVDVTDCLEVTTHIVDDEMIGLQTEGTVNGQLLRPNEPPHLARRTFSKHVVLEPGMSLIVGGTDQTEGLVRTQTDVLFILTPTIARAGEPSDENERQLDDEPTGRPGARTVSAMTTRATSPAKGATPIRIGCFVLEIPYYPGADKNIARDAWTILGDKMSVPPVDSGPVAYAGRLLKAVIEEPHPADKDWGRDITVTQAELEKLIRMLAAGGYIRILFEPTVLVGDGQTAEVRNDRQSFRVKADLLDDGDMVLQTHVSVGSEIAPQDKDQKPMATVRTFDTTAHLRPGRAAIVGGAGTAPTSTVSREAKHTAEIMCILTTDKDDSTTTEDGGNKGGDRTNNENVERPTPRTSAQQDKIHYPRNWGEVVGNGVIGIATAKALPRNMVTRVYDVTDLVGDPADHGGMTRVMQVHSLVHLIQSQVEPDSWYDVSDAGQGTATPFPLQEPKKLAVYNTVEVHRQIERLLQAVRSGAERVPVPQEMTIRGRCIDSEGRPLSDSRVLVFSVTDAPKQIAQARTDSRGYFKLGPVASLTEEDYGRKRYLILVYADGHGPAWKRIYEHEQAASLLELKAYDSAEVIGTIVTENSKPAAGALVWVRGIIPPEATEDPNSRDNDLFTPAPLPEWSATTGSDGSFRIAGLADRSRIQLGVTHPDFAESLVHVKPGKSAVIEVQPAATVTGRVLYGKTGEPAVGVRVQAQGVDHTSIPGGWMLGWAETTTDNQGRYMLRSLAGNSYNIWAKAEDLTVRALDSFKVEAGQAHQAPDLRLIEGGFIAGRVIDEVTGESVKPGFASDVAVYGPSRPKSGAAVEISHVREDGSFRIRAAPGRNYVYLRPMDDWGREKAAVYPPGHWVNVATGQSVKVEFKIRKYSQEELDRQDNRGSRIRIRIPKTVDELDQSGSRMKQLRAGAPQRPSSKPFDRWIVLNAALKMYSKDHDGKLPDDLGALESYIPLRQHFEWIVENTEFLAPGRHLGLMQNWAPIACDKEYFANGWFADVLFSDGHTESMYPAQIKELAELDRQVKESGEMLMYFGRAMLIYANDHDGRYPNLPDQLREYLRTDQFTWAMRNVEYLAAGKTTSSPPDVVLAYRKLIPGAKGTNVLFNDGHVEFVSGARMRDLNISIAPILIETRILTVDDNFLRAIELDANSVGTSELLSAASGAEPNSWPYLVVLDDLEVNHLLRAVAAHDGAKILAAPQVVALDGREAKIKIVSEEYHLLRPTDPNDPPEEAKPKPEAVEVGTSIRLTPHVTRDKKNIVLDFEWVLRQIRGFEQRAGPDKKKHKFPLVSVNETRTTATIPEGKTLVVGRKNTEQVEVSSKTPVLGDLPLVGGLFRNYSKITDKKTLLILIKPTVDPQMPHPPPLDPDDPLAKKLRWKFERDEMSRDID